ncbi:MAG: hypothetical protein ACTSQO_06790 [Candidatus Helarchaeota archaeon]
MLPKVMQATLNIFQKIYQFSNVIPKISITTKFITKALINRLPKIAACLYFWNNKNSPHKKPAKIVKSVRPVAHIDQISVSGLNH